MAPREPPGYYMRLLVAGSRGIAGRPVSLADIDLGATFDELLEDVETGHAQPASLTIEQAQIWGALCLYAFSRSKALGVDCKLLQKPFTPSQIKTITRGRDLLRAREIGGAHEAAKIIESLTVETELRARILEDEIFSEDPPIVEVEARPMVGRSHRIRARINPITPWDDALTFAAVLEVTDDPTTRVVIIEARDALVMAGRVAIRLTNEWSEVTFQLRGRGKSRSCSIELVGVEGWRGSCTVTVGRGGYMP